MNKIKRVYLDTINAAPLKIEVVHRMQEVLQWWGNPSSGHAEGRAAAKALAKAREEVALLLKARPGEILFTSSGTESNQLALQGIAQAYRSRGRHLVISAVEHLSIFQTARQLEKEGWTVTVVPVDSDGRIDFEALKRALRTETVLVSIQWANAEVGTIQPAVDWVLHARERGIFTHVDAVAAVGQEWIDLEAVPIDALSLTAQAMGGPAGVGALFLRKGVRIQPQTIGGTQEEGRRAGTENLVGIAGMGKAAVLARQGIRERRERLVDLRGELMRQLSRCLPEIRLNGHPTDRLPGHLSVSIPGVDAQTLIGQLDLKGISVGLGSACTSLTLKASHVLKAMGVETSLALSTITLTLSEENNLADLDRFLEVFPEAAENSRTESKVQV